MRHQGLGALLICALGAAGQTVGVIHNAESAAGQGRGAALGAETSVVAATVPPELESITAAKLRGHVSYLASDLLEGRDSPSRGLDLAAEYIASQFRAAGLEPLGDDGYFQTIHWTVLSAPDSGTTLEIDGAAVDAKHFRVTAGGGIDAEGEVMDLRAGETADKIVRLESAQRSVIADAITFLRNAPPKIVLIPDERDTLRASGVFQPRAILTTGGPARGKYVYVILTGPAAALVAGAKTARFHMPPAVETPSRVWNVAGVLRGSDVALGATAVVASAHYDHEGLRPENANDRVMNGANDNASGTAVLIETARALATLKARPKRSIVFLAVAAEEKGLLGAKYYARHPLWPLETTVANLNFEMFGRTEEGEYTRAGQATMTGAGFSTVTDVVKRACADLGIRFFVHPQGNEEFFARSDNFAFAEKGIPAHTLAPGFSFAQYHQLGDEWQTLDYENMERAGRMAALATLRLAGLEAAPEWDVSNPAIKKYAERRKAAAGAPAAGGADAAGASPAGGKPAGTGKAGQP